MCTIGCTLRAEVDRTLVIDALDDIFLKIQNKLVFYRTYKEWPYRKQAGLKKLADLAKN